MIDEQTNQRINAILDYLGEVTKQGVDFASDQIPLVAREIAVYGAVTGWALVGTGIIGWCLVAWFIRKYQRAPKSLFDDGGGWICAAAVVAVCSCFLIGGGGDRAIKATFAPRLYVLEYVADLARGK